MPNALDMLAGTVKWSNHDQHQPCKENLLAPTMSCSGVPIEYTYWPMLSLLEQ